MMPSLKAHVPVPRPSYSQARENLVRAIPPRLLCLLACGGVDCRYEGPECWTSRQQVIRGLFSSWVTDDIIAMARPSTALIEKYNIIQQFQRLNIRSVINMQLPGEHAHCGPALHPGSGFTYCPQVFMDNDIYFYNFGMPDFSVSSLVCVIDAVKVLAFAVRQGRVAVHCHAGLGRTGVLIACYLIYTLRISPSEAVHFVRIQRPRSIQTRAQISQVFDFARLFGTQLIQYPDLSLRHGTPFTLQHYLNRQMLLLHGEEGRILRYTPKVVYLLCVRLSCLALGLPAPREVQAELENRSALRTLGRTVRETLVDKHFLPLLTDPHGGWCSGSCWDERLGFWDRKRDARLDRRSYSDSDLRKITNLDLCQCWTTTPAEDQLIHSDLKPSSPAQRTFRNTHGCSENLKNSAEKLHPKHRSNTELHRNFQRVDSSSAAQAVAEAMADHRGPSGPVLQRSALLQEELNTSDCGWALLVTESDPQLLSCLLWTWLEKLRDPLLGPEDVDRLCSSSGEKNHRKSLRLLKKAQRQTLECLLSCIRAVSGLSPHREDPLLQRLIWALTKRPLEESSNPTVLLELLKAALREKQRLRTRSCSCCAAL